MLYEDGIAHVRDSHKIQQADAGGKPEDTLHWIVERYWAPLPHALLHDAARARTGRYRDWFQAAPPMVRGAPSLWPLLT